MSDLNVIDQFLTSFSRYIDGGFGLLGGHVRALTSLLVGIDVTLAGLFWAMGGEDDIIARLVKKVLFVGAFAFILNSFSALSGIIFQSFASLGLIAGGGTLSAEDLLKPGHLAGTGFSAAWPLLDQASKLMGFAGFFNNFLTIVILLVAWLIVIIAFFVLAVQLFVTILEFKLTSLAGFVLVPFAFWNRTSFLAERVLGTVVTSGVKVMVLAVIVGIGSGYFAQFTTALQGQEPDVGQAMSLVLASLALLGLGIFGPGLSAGLVSGAPQLGAGAAIGTAGLAVGGATLGAGAAVAGGRLLSSGALNAVRAGASLGTSWTPGPNRPGAGPGVSGNHSLVSPVGTGSAARSGGAAPSSAPDSAQQPDPAYGQASADSSAGEPMPDWARRLQAAQRNRQLRQGLIQTLREGDRGGSGAAPDISERED